MTSEGNSGLLAVMLTAREIYFHIFERLVPRKTVNFVSPKSCFPRQHWDSRETK